MRRRAGNNEAPINIENPYILLAASIRQMLDTSVSREGHCIYRVPAYLRCKSKDVYTPSVISIGTLHHDNGDLKPMEELKRSYLKKFLHRVDVRLEVYIKKIKDQEEKLRACYADVIEFSSEDFIQIMMVDAAFVIEILLKLCGHRFNPLGVDDHDNISSKSWIINYIMPDMLKLENQVPFCILEDLLELQRIAADANSNITYVIPSMMNLAFEFINMTFSSTSMVQNVGMLGSSSLKVEHFIAFLRLFYLPKDSHIINIGGEVKAVNAPSISELEMAGVKIVWGSSTSLSAIRFVDGILEIPRLLIHNGSELLFRNIVAFEQCHGCPSYVNSYLSILDDFVNAPMDVELLVRKGIFINMLSDHNEVSTLINDLGKGVVISDFYFGSVREELDRYLKSPWIKWKSTLKRHFFNSPWATKQMIPFIIILMLTIIQMVYSTIK
ncbi:UPF0481 protein At3g47200-like [Prunus avium]|uniref:UPF0481 protein At3g47200-like n=1 Tax=Prunus avium TaxID=42229 RepID=A0A6P5RJP7_PRUAV|nr:UPF0481 protein At3g47200-like [Prunus avium]